MKTKVKSHTRTSKSGKRSEVKKHLRNIAKEGIKLSDKSDKIKAKISEIESNLPDEIKNNPKYSKVVDSLEKELERGRLDITPEDVKNQIKQVGKIHINPLDKNTIAGKLYQQSKDLRDDEIKRRQESGEYKL